MTNDRSGKSIGETARKHLVECYVEEIYKRPRKDKDNKYIEKGLRVEEDSITLYSRATKRFYKKNTEQITNHWFIGTPDLYLGESIYQAEEIKDIKSSWDIFTFFGVVVKPTNDLYKAQLNAYMDMTGANTSGLVYCLVNTPFDMVEYEKYIYRKKCGVIDDEAHPEVRKHCEEIELLANYDDIPLEKRYIEIKVDRDNDFIEQAHQRVIQCREIMNSWT